MTVIGYVRGSKEEQKNTIEMQDHEIARWAKGKNLTVDRIFTDAGVSGGLLMEKRPAGKDLLAFLENPPNTGHRTPTATLVIWKMDRLFRGLFDAVTVIKRFDEWRVSLVSLTENLDMATPAGRAFFHTLVTFAEYERAMISERIRASKDWCRLKGRFMGHHNLVYGFKKVWRGEYKMRDGKKSKIYYQEPDFLELAVRAKVKELAEEGCTKAEIGRILLDAGLRPRGGGPWHHELLRRLMVDDDLISRRYSHLLPDLPGKVET